MALDFLKQASLAREATQPEFEDKEASNLSDAERALQELAAVFLQQQCSVSNSSFEFTEAAKFVKKSRSAFA